MSLSVGVDVGTSNVKVVAVDADGNVVASATAPLVTHIDGNTATQDPHHLWQAVLGCVARTVEVIPPGLPPVRTMGVCSQYSSIVPVDAAGRPLHDMKLYLDQRGTDECLSVLAADDDNATVWFQRHGLPPVGGGLSLGHLLWFQHHHPRIHDAAAAYLEPMDYITARLTGRICATQGSMFTSQLVDNQTLGAVTYDAELVARAGVDSQRLPELVPGDAIVGELTEAVAAEVGLHGPVEVRAAMNDSHAGAFASGAWSGNAGGLMVGTTAVLLDHLDAPVGNLSQGLVAMPGPLADAWLVWAENGLAGKVVDHVLTGLVTPDGGDAPQGADDGHGGFDRLGDALAAVAPGSDGVLFLPWLAGAMAPVAAPAMRGGFVNVSLATGRNHLVRAAVEGTAHNVRWLLDAVEGLTGRPMDPVVLGGGAARSMPWAQVFADVTGRPVRVLAWPELAAARAVALTAMMGPARAGADSDGVVVRTAGEVEPRDAHRAMYDDHQRRFQEAFVALRSLSEGV